MTFPSIDELEVALRDASYLPDRGLATALFLALKLEKPLLLEGEAGVGKTEAAKALAAVLDTPLIRLQCYEGIDADQRSEEHTSELQSRQYLVCRLLLEKKKKNKEINIEKYCH